MELDFSKLNNISILKNEDEISHYNEQNKDALTNTPLNTEDGLNRLKTCSRGYSIISNKNEDEIKHIKTYLQEHTEDGTELFKLYLEALRGLALATNDLEFYELVKANTIKYRGEVLEEVLPLEFMIEDVEKEIRTFENKLKYTKREDKQQEIHNSIQAHQKKLQELQDKLNNL